ncbi:hypothetical protein EPC74_01215 [Helicobacter pylori]|nr:hypothetical protein EPC72_01125 [Helicobacter pylori]KAA6511705.1 hypothetical protein EPC74_01215 [Helicobacter pylori]
MKLAKCLVECLIFCIDDSRFYNEIPLSVSLIKGLLLYYKACIKRVCFVRIILPWVSNIFGIFSSILKKSDRCRRLKARNDSHFYPQLTKIC